MKARYNYRIYPTVPQQRALAQLFGCVRVVYNDSLTLCRYDGVVKTSVLQKLFITLAKKTETRAWLGDVSSVPLQQSIADLGIAFKNFFESCSGKRKGQKVGYPQFKKKCRSQSARFTKAAFSVKDDKVYLAKIGLLKTKWSRKLPSNPSSVTVIKDNINRYFLSFVVEIEPEIIPAKNKSIGADLGIKIFAALSTNERVFTPDYSVLNRRIKRAQRVLSRRKKGSSRREKARLRVAKLKAKLAAKRKDFLHKLSTRLTKENQILSLEDLNVTGMVKNRKLARVISEAGWRMFRSMCQAKGNKYICDVRIINRWQPTSQICADCGYKWGKLDLSVREIVCLGCNKLQNRDDNASSVINRIGLGHSHDGRRGTWSGNPTVSASYKWTGSGHKTSDEAIHVELSTRKLEYIQLSLF